MIEIPQGPIFCWQDFSLLIEKKLTFEPGMIYNLQGENGCGKSSFLKHCLLPVLESKKDLIYRIYLQQLFHLQGYAIKSHSAFYKPELELRSELDCVQYLLNNLFETFSQDPRPVYCIVDENRYIQEIHRYLKENDFPFCLIYCAHSSFSLSEDVNIVNFKVINPKQSIIYEATI